MIKNFEDIQTMSKANMDATMKSFEVVAKSTQAIATEIADYSRRSFENGTKAAEKLIGAKSLACAGRRQARGVKLGNPEQASFAYSLCVCARRSRVARARQRRRALCC